MKIIVIGASGTIGRAVSEELSQRHDVIRVGRTRGDYQVDITSQESVETLFAQTGEVDAIVSTTGNLHFGPLSTMTDSQFNLGLQDKLLGQIRLALVGQHFLRIDFHTFDQLKYHGMAHRFHIVHPPLCQISHRK